MPMPSAARAGQEIRLCLWAVLSMCEQCRADSGACPVARIHLSPAIVMVQTAGSGPAELMLSRCPRAPRPSEGRPSSSGRLLGGGRVVGSLRFSEDVSPMGETQFGRHHRRLSDPTRSRSVLYTVGAHTRVI